ncbi:MAG TPA: hypothetical protein V6D50_13700 [Chroococcales cyanobacterium]
MWNGTDLSEKRSLFGKTKNWGEAPQTPHWGTGASPRPPAQGLIGEG